MTILNPSNSSWMLSAKPWTLTPPLPGKGTHFQYHVSWPRSSWSSLPPLSLLAVARVAGRLSVVCQGCCYRRPRGRLGLVTANPLLPLPRSFPQASRGVFLIDILIQRSESVQLRCILATVTYFVSNVFKATTSSWPSVPDGGVWCVGTATYTVLNIF